MATALFRKSALDKLASPERLDRMVTYADPKAWLALGVLAALLLLALSWSVLGRIPSRLHGQGVLLSQAGWREVSAPSTGRFEPLRALGSGDAIQAGQALGRISPVATAQERPSGSPGVGNASPEAKANPAVQPEASPPTGAVTSPYSGTVVELKVGNGDWVVKGQPLLELDAGGTPLLAEVYLPADSPTHAIQPGARVQLLPHSKRNESDGFLEGRVMSISSYPASRQGMLARLRNPQLVDRLLAAGTPLVLRVELARTDAGDYRWSGSKGASIALSSGMVCDASVILGESRPIALVFPWLRQFLGA